MDVQLPCLDNLCHRYTLFNHHNCTNCHNKIEVLVKNATITVITDVILPMYDIVLGHHLIVEYENQFVGR